MGLNRWLGCIENPRTGREAGRPRRPAPRRRPQRRSWSSAPGRPGCRPRSPPPATATTSTVYEQRRRSPAARCGSPPSVPNRAEFGDLVRNQLAECRRARRRRSSTASRRRPGWSPSAGPTHVIVATGAEPARPWWAPADAGNVVDVRDVLDGTAPPDRRRRGRSTSSASTRPRRSPSCWPTAAARSRSSPTGMVVGQDLGITLDMEDWWMRAAAKGIVQSHRPRADGRRTAATLHAAAPPDRHEVRRARRLGRAGGAGRTRSSGCTSSCERRAGVERAPRRRLRRAPAGPRRGDRGRAGAGPRCDAMLAVVAVRDGRAAGRRGRGGGRVRRRAPCCRRIGGRRGGEAARGGHARSRCVETRRVRARRLGGGRWRRCSRDDDVVVLPASADGRDLAPRLAARARPAAARRCHRGRPPHGATRRAPAAASSIETSTRRRPVRRHAASPASAASSPRSTRRAGPSSSSTSTVDARRPAATPSCSSCCRPTRPPWTWPRRRASSAGGAGLDGAERVRAARAGRRRARRVGGRHPRRHRRGLGRATTARSAPPASSSTRSCTSRSASPARCSTRAGSADPDHIVSVNTDPHCPMMALADLAIVADATRRSLRRARLDASRTSRP